MFKALEVGSKMLTRAGAVRQLATFQPENLTLIDFPNEHMFKMPLNNSGFATVEYEKSGNIYVLQHSEVPKQFQGHGLGRILAEKTFKLVKTKNLKVRLECEFLLDYYKRHKKDYSGYVVQ